MKREVKLLHKKALDSLILSIEHFNRPDDRGRVSSVLILLDLHPHAAGRSLSDANPSRAL
jgi:hypothetical protein